MGKLFRNVVVQTDTYPSSRDYANIFYEQHKASVHAGHKLSDLPSQQADTEFYTQAASTVFRARKQQLFNMRSHWSRLRGSRSLVLRGSKCSYSLRSSVSEPSESVNEP